MEVDRYAKMAASDSAQSAVNSSANLAVKGVNWSTALVSQLIELLQHHPCLYNTKEKSYHDRNVRAKAINEMATILKVQGN